MKPTITLQQAAMLWNQMLERRVVATHADGNVESELKPLGAMLEQS